MSTTITTPDPWLCHICDRRHTNACPSLWGGEFSPAPPAVPALLDRHAVAELILAGRRDGLDGATIAAAIEPLIDYNTLYFTGDAIGTGDMVDHSYIGERRLDVDTGTVTEIFGMRFSAADEDQDDGPRPNPFEEDCA